MARDANIVGEALAGVLPSTDKYWFQQSHLLRLNGILFIPMLSSAVFGYDGRRNPLISDVFYRGTNNVVANVQDP